MWLLDFKVPVLHTYFRFFPAVLHMTKEMSLIPNSSLTFHVFPRRQLNIPVWIVWLGVCFSTPSEEVPWQVGFALGTTESQPIIVRLHIRQVRDPEKLGMLLRHFWPYLWALVKSLVTPSKWWMSPELSGCSRVTFQQCWHLSAPEPPSTTSGAPVGQGAMNSSTVRRNAKYCPGAH